MYILFHTYFVRVNHLLFVILPQMAGSWLIV